MVKLLTSLLLVLCLSGTRAAKDCSCRKAQKGERTYWGWIIDSPDDAGVVKRIRGKVENHGGEPVADVLVEIFDHPEVRTGEDLPASRKKQRRVAACKTGADGEFCFAGIQAGKYEVRCSKPVFDTSSVMVTLAPNLKGASGDGLKVLMDISH
jgi:hypothetical protein